MPYYNVTVNQAMAMGLERQQAGMLPQAEAIYRQILTYAPQHVEALHMLGVVSAMMGRLGPAADFIRQAIAAQPTYAEAHFNLGNVLSESRQWDGAAAAYRKAIELKPDYAEAVENLGTTLQSMQRPEEAIQAYERALELRPNHPYTYYNLGNAQREKGDYDQAVAAYQRAVELKPDYLEAQANIGLAWHQKGDSQRAAACYRQLLAKWPNYAEGYLNLGAALHRQGDVDGAIGAYRTALAKKPDYVQAYTNMGTALQDKLDIAGAIACYDQALALRPDHPGAHWNRALALLMRGDFLEGWKEYEWRWKNEDCHTPPRQFRQPEWDGSPLAGRRILLHAEQGYGDAIQFLRFSSVVAAQGGEVIVGCDPALHRLAKGVAGVREVVEKTDQTTFDVHCPLMSLPRVLGTTLETIPRHVPYVHVDAATVERWRQRLSGMGQGLKVGLAWAGRAQHVNDRQRSMPVEVLAPLAEAAGVQWISLQKGSNVTEGWITDYTSELHDFADTAALVAALDLVICVDTSVAHLAGALGQKTWVMLAHWPDWRWMLGRSDSPWYPTIRLFRQAQRGDWSGVVAQVRQALATQTTAS